MKKKKETPVSKKEQELLLQTADEKKEDAEAAMEADIELFCTLFPDVEADGIPEEVWDSVEGGERLSAAFALYFVKKLRDEEHVRRVNEENGKKAPPPVEGTDGSSDYFSPEAVKGMSRKEIRKNYDKILSSMEHWN